MIQRPPRSTRTDPLFPYTTLFRSVVGILISIPVGLGAARNLAPKPVYYFCRGVLAVSRSFQEVILAIFFVKLFGFGPRSEEHTSELQSLMRISYAVFCLKKKNKINTQMSHQSKLESIDQNQQ